MKINKNKLLAFNLMEMVITTGIIAILAGVGIARLSKLKSPREIVDETTNIIVSTINQVIFNSLSTSTSGSNSSRSVCSIQAGTGANLATCNLALTTATNNSWNNINNIAFNNNVIVTFYDRGEINPISQITYQQGLIYSIINPTNTSTSTIINSTNEGQVNPITIRIRFAANPNNCVNTINLWANNVITINKGCTI